MEFVAAAWQLRHTRLAVSAQVTAQRAQLPPLHAHLGKEQKAAQNSVAGEPHPAFPVPASF